MCTHLKIYVAICDFFRVFLLEHFYFLKCFYCCLPCLIWFFTKTHNSHFHSQIKQKRQAITSTLPSSENDKLIWKHFKPNKPIKESSVICQHFGVVYNYLLYTSKYTSRLYTSVVITLSFYKDSYQVRPYLSW